MYVFHNLQRNSHASQFLILNLTFDKDVNSLQSLGKIFQILALEEVIVSVPYLTELTLLLLRVSTLRKLYLKFLNLKTSSMITGFKAFLLKISVASICRFPLYLDSDLFCWKVDSYSLKTILKARSWILFMWFFNFLLWNLHTSEQYPTCEKMNAFIINLRCAKFIWSANLAIVFNFWEAFLHNEVTC